MPAPATAIIIGGGPAGYAAAFGLAQHGVAVQLIEEQAPGGTCIHRGCIPTKALLESARLAREYAAAPAFGIALAPPQVDWPAVRRHQEKVVAAMAAGLGQLLQANGVTVVRGRGSLLAPASRNQPPTVRVTGPDARDMTADVIVLAPGSAPAHPPIPGRDLPGVLDSDGLLVAPQPPRQLVIIGGGVIACEFATAHAALGAEVAILEAMPQLLPAADTNIARRLEAAFRRRGITVHTDAKVLSIEPGLTVRAETPSGPLALPADTVLIATGRRPRTENMGLDEVGVRRAQSGAIVVDEAFRCPGTTGVWAVGDAVGGPMLAHAGFHQAATIVAAIMGLPLPDAAPIPSPVFAYPEVAWVGATEAAATASGTGVRVARVPFGSLGRAHAAGDTDGMCKVIADAQGRIVGVHLIGAHATELIGAGCLAVARGLRLEEVASTVFPHPTLAEGLVEGVDLLLGHPLHTLPPRRLHGAGA